MQNTDPFDNIVKLIDPYKLYRTKEVAGFLQCSIRYIQIMVEVGRLDSLHIGRLIRIPGREVIRFIETYKAWDQ